MDRETRRLLRDIKAANLPIDIIDTVELALTVINQQHARNIEDRDKDQLISAVSRLKALRAIMPEWDPKKSPWNDEKMVKWIFTLETMYFEGTYIRDYAPSDEIRYAMSSKLQVLREAIVQVHNGNMDAMDEIADRFVEAGDDWEE